MMVGSPFPAVRLLTRIPVPLGVPDDERTVAASVPYLPLVGLAIGSLLAAMDAGLRLLLATSVVDALLLVALAAVTGAFHLDGLMDSADGLFVRADRVRRLQIMRDSRVGAFGVAALALTLLTEYAALGALPPSARWLALALMGLTSRWSIPLVAALFPYARSEGTGMAVRAGATLPALAAGTAVAAGCAVALAGVWGLAMMGWVALVAVATGGFAAQRLGGLTGDVYGAVVVLSEVAALLAAPLLLARVR
jgi:cobalamin 5'-phosphate synthase/cobalamin synthase